MADQLHQNRCRHALPELAEYQTARVDRCHGSVVARVRPEQGAAGLGIANGDFGGHPAADHENGKHRFNAAAFFFEWTNQQFTQATPFDTNGDGEIDADLVDYQTVAGKSEIKGAEFFYSGWLGKYFNLTATYNYNDAKYKVFEDATVGRVHGSKDASGKTMPRCPKSSATPGLGFVLPISGAWDFNARADYVYRGSSYTWAVNLAETGATNRLSLRTGIRSDNFDISVWMNNVTDDDTLMAIRRFSALENFVSPTWWAGLPGVQEIGVTFRVLFF